MAAVVAKVREFLNKNPMVCDGLVVLLIRLDDLAQPIPPK